MNQGGLLHKPVLALGAVLLSGVAPTPGRAQEQGADKLEEIVVTARRREESLQTEIGRAHV